MSLKKVLFSKESDSHSGARQNQHKKRQIKNLLQLFEQSIAHFQKAKSKAYKLQNSLRVIDNVYHHIEHLLSTVDAKWLTRYQISPIIKALANSHQNLRELPAIYDVEQKTVIEATIKQLEKTYCDHINNLPGVIETRLKNISEDYKYLEQEMFDNHLTTKSF